MPLSLIALVGLIVLAAAAASYALVTDRQRRAVLDRATGLGDSLLVRKPRQASAGERLSRWLAKRIPNSLTGDAETGNRLLHAGFDGPGALATYGMIRLTTFVGLPALAYFFAPRTKFLYFVATMLLAVIVGLLAAPAILDSLVRKRQERLRRSLPDSLDLMVVCVEAGISLDAAMLRVAREMGSMHPDLAGELLAMNRKVNAGMSREQAMHGLWVRTGVEELRGLASNMIQSEKWGTSIAKVLRVYAETLRRKRKQAAEKKAATAPLKMMVPLALFIFPTIFIVLLGPAVIKINTMFGNVNR